MVDSVQIVLFGVACGVGTDAVSQELLLSCTPRGTLSQTSAAGAVHRFARCWRLPPRAAAQMPPTGDACRADPRGRHPLSTVPVAALRERPR
jgi:hypothetical protein